MRRWILPALAAALAGCVSADGGAPTADQAPAFAHGQCFRASDVTNYNVKAPHAVFVRTNRGYVFGLVSDDCFDDNTSAVSLAQSRRADLWLCAGEEAEVNVGTFPCMARVTNAIVDEDVSGFRGRAAQG